MTITSASVESSAVPNAEIKPRWMWALRLLASIAGGLLLYLANPPRDLWWLAPFGITLLCLALHGRRARAGFGYGLVFGLAWMLPLFSWLFAFLGSSFGPWPWIGVAAVCAILFAVPCIIMALASTLRWAPLWMACSVVVGEAIRDRFPAGGFPWARLAFTQPSGALLPLALIGGAPLVTFAVALIGAGIARLIVLRHKGKRLVLPAALTVIPVVLGLALLPVVDGGTNTGSVRAMTIQGNGPDIGINLLYAGDVLATYNQRQVDKTAADIAAGRVKRPDLAIVGETVLDLPGTAPDDLGQVKAIADQLGVPVALGARSLPENGPARNVIVGVDPNTGKTGEYTKWHLVPFSETIPWRALAVLVSPFLGHYSDMTAGTAPGVIPLGKAKLGVGICFDIAYDDVLRSATNNGANLLSIPTNNAWFGHTEMTYQQQAMGRIRAVEHDRAVLVASTTGSSAAIMPDGTIATRTGQFTAEAMSAEVPLRSDITVADKVGAWPEWIMVALALAGLGGGIRVRSRARAQTKQGDGDDRAGAH